MFKVGEKVLCTDPPKGTRVLTFGKEYTITSISYDRVLVKVFGDQGLYVTCHAGRFERLSGLERAISKLE